MSIESGIISHNSKLITHYFHINSNRPDSDLEIASSEKIKESGDTVDISSRAKELQTDYQRKNSELEQRKNHEVQQLERKFLLEKNELEQEFRLKKQRLDINVYA